MCSTRRSSCPSLSCQRASTWRSCGSLPWAASLRCGPPGPTQSSRWVWVAVRLVARTHARIAWHGMACPAVGRLLCRTRPACAPRSRPTARCAPVNQHQPAPLPHPPPPPPRTGQGAGGAGPAAGRLPGHPVASGHWAPAHQQVWACSRVCLGSARSSGSASHRAHGTAWLNRTHSAQHAVRLPTLPCRSRTQLKQACLAAATYKVLAEVVPVRWRACLGVCAAANTGVLRQL
jgi:hypothetical protein